MIVAAFFMLMVSYPLASLALTQDEYDTAYDYLYDYWRTGDGRSETQSSGFWAVLLQRCQSDRALGFVICSFFYILPRLLSHYCSYLLTQAFPRQSCSRDTRKHR